MILSAIRVSDWVSCKMGLIRSSDSSIGCWSVENESVERGEMRCERRLTKYTFDLLSRIAICNEEGE